MSVINDLKYQKLSALLGGSRTISDLEMEWLTSLLELPISDNLVSNGTFDSDTDWSKNIGWTIGSNVASCDGTQGFLYQDSGLVVNTSYKITFDVSAYTSGTLQFRTYDGSYNTRLIITSAGSYELEFTTSATGNGSIYFYGLDIFIGSIDNVVITRSNNLVSNGTFDNDIDWSKGTDWTISAGVATKAAGISISELSQTVNPTDRIPHNITFTLSGYTGGGITPKLGGISGTQRTANGVYTETIIAGAADELLAFSGTTTFGGSIDIVSLKDIAYKNKDINVLWHIYWDSLSIAGVDTNTRKFAWLGSLGFTGTLPERESRYWTAF